MEELSSLERTVFYLGQHAADGQRISRQNVFDQDFWHTVRMSSIIAFVEVPGP